MKSMVNYSCISIFRTGKNVWWMNEEWMRRHSSRLTRFCQTLLDSVSRGIFSLPFLNTKLTGMGQVKVMHEINTISYMCIFVCRLNFPLTIIYKNYYPLYRELSPFVFRMISSCTESYHHVLRVITPCIKVLYACWTVQGHRFKKS